MALEDQVIDTTTEETEVPLEDTIRAAIRGDDPAPIDNTAEPVASAPKVDRARDEEGKFAPVSKERKTITLPEKTPVATSPTDPLAQTAAPVVKAPYGWKAELKAKWGEIPDWAQAEITRRESDVQKLASKQEEDRQFAKRVNDIVNPYIPQIRAEGGTVEKAIGDLLNTAHVLRNGNDIQKAQNVAAVMQQFKVSPQVLFSILQGGNVNNGMAVQPQFDPNISAMQQRLDRIERERQQEIQQRQLQEEQGLQGQIDSFSTTPGHEHFDRVRTHMGVLLENGIATDLEDAYQRAVYADPETRSSLLAATTQAQQGQRVTEVRAKAEAARRAGGSVSGSPGSATPLNGAGTNVPIEETIRAAIRESAGRIN